MAGGGMFRQDRRHRRQHDRQGHEAGGTSSPDQHRLLALAHPGPETLANAATAQVYLTSVNALAETGELINIDGTGNRISAATGAHECVYYLVGRNKLAETFDKALWRARNIASPLNARRLNRETPCVKNELKCYDCNSPQRICNGLSVVWKPLGGAQETHVLLIDEDLGY